VSVSEGTFRTVYVTKLGNYIAVLHCWQKKSQATADVNKQIIVDRYKAAKIEIENE